MSAIHRLAPEAEPESQSLSETVQTVTLTVFSITFTVMTRSHDRLMSDMSLMRLMSLTSNSRPWRSIGSFMYIGSAGPGPGGRTGGRTNGKADGRAGGRYDFKRQYNDFHRISQKASKNTVFFCCFASGRSASTDFYSSNEKGVQNMSKTHRIFDFSNHARAQVPIFTPKMKKKSGSPALPALPGLPG